jgi:SAM-dependent methyltransferase
VAQTATAGSTSPAQRRAPCPFCGGRGRHALLARDRNREITQERFDYARCEDCGTVFIAEVPPDLDRYYEGDYYHFDAAGEPLWRTNEHRIRSAEYRVGLLAGRIPPGHLIEIGSGTGAFAAHAKRAGFDVTAIEMDPRCCAYLSEREGIPAICTDRPLEALASLPPASAIAMWHVLEHLPDPAELLEEIARKLEPGGLLAIGVPNASSLQFRLLRSRWAHLDAPRHLSLIPPRTLIGRCEELGLQAVEVLTTDPEGLEFNAFGWINAIRRRPASGAAPRATVLAASLLSRAASPLERSGLRGSTVTLIMRKEDASGGRGAV